METKANYIHDCNKCTFLGSYIDNVSETHDLYFHNNSTYRSIIARHSSECADYTSYPDYTIEREMKYGHIRQHQPEIVEAYNRSLKYRLPLRIYLKRTLGFEKCWHDSQKERWRLMVVEVFSIVDAIVYLLTLGTYQTALRPKLLFSEWLKEEDSNE